MMRMTYWRHKDKITLKRENDKLFAFFTFVCYNSTYNE